MANSNSLLSDYKSNANANKDIKHPTRVKMKSLFCYDSDKKKYLFEAATFDGRLYKSTIDEVKYGGILDSELFDKTQNKFNLYGDKDYFAYEVLSGIRNNNFSINESIEVERNNNLFGVTTKGLCSDCSIIREEVYDFSTSANYITRVGNNLQRRACKVNKVNFRIFNHFDSKKFEPRESAKKFESVSEKYKGAW